MIVRAVEPSGHVKGRYLIHLDQGEVLKVTDMEVVAFGLYPGAELDGQTLSDLRQAAAVSNARALAARIISCRPLSRKELLQRLEEKGIAPGDGVAAADWLQELGILDDGAYAASVVRHYSRRGYGQKKLESELYRRGVPREYWEAALQEQSPEQEGIAAFLQNRFRNRDPRDPKEVRRASDALLRRGYSWAQVKEGLSAYIEIEECE